MELIYSYSTATMELLERQNIRKVKFQVNGIPSRQLNKNPKLI